jgi:salicylate hydroxylase
MVSKSQSADVIIVGGGIGGLMLAAICRKLNISFLVLERSEEITPLGAGISLSPNALRVLDQLGIYDKIREEGQDVRKMLVYRNSTKWRELDFTRLQDRFGYPVYCIERHVFHELLFKSAGGKDFVHFNEKVVDLVDDPAESFVTVKTESGGEFRGTVVVGADGIRSVTRRLLATKSGVESAKNTIKFTGRVHMSGFTNPINHLTEKEAGVGCWMLNDGAIMTTWSCKDNRQMYSGAKVSLHNFKIMVHEAFV